MKQLSKKIPQVKSTHDNTWNIYGEGKEEYWMSEKFMEQIKSAVKIVERKYPRAEGW